MRKIEANPSDTPLPATGRNYVGVNFVTRVPGRRFTTETFFTTSKTRGTTRHLQQPKMSSEALFKKLKQNLEWLPNSRNFANNFVQYLITQNLSETELETFEKNVL